MNTTIEIKSIISCLFASVNNSEELKTVANSICSQVKEAYNARFKEIIAQTGSKAETPATSSKPKTEAKKTTAKPKTPEPAKPAAKPKAEADNDTVIEVIDLKSIKKLGLTFEKYNDRCWVLRGETKPLRKILKEQFKGVFNSHLSGGEGWVIKNASAEECAKALGLKMKAA